MPTHKPRNSNIPALALLCFFTLGSTSFAETGEIALPSDRAYPESVASAPDGTLYVGSPAVGGVWRIRTSSGAVEEWIKPGAFGSRSTLGVLVDNKANLLWVCSNDFSSIGIPGPSSVPGSFVKGFDLSSGEGRVSAALPGKATLCNDMVVGADGSLFVTDSLAPQILKLKPGSNQLEVWLESPAFEQPPGGAPGLDGIAFGGDGNLYVNTFAKGDFFRIDVKDVTPGKITKLQPSRPLNGGINTDGELLTNSVNWKADRLGRIDLSHEYLEKIAHLVGGKVRRVPNPGEWYVVEEGTKLPKAIDLLSQPSKWLPVVRWYTSELSSALERESA